LSFRRILVVLPDGEGPALRNAILDADPSASVDVMVDAARALGRAAAFPPLDVAFVGGTDALGAVALAATLSRLSPRILLALVTTDAAATASMAKRMGLAAAVMRAPIAAAEVAVFLGRSVHPAED
jgi:hypothetical protein